MGECLLAVCPNRSGRPGWSVRPAIRSILHPPVLQSRPPSTQADVGADSKESDRRDPRTADPGPTPRWKEVPIVTLLLCAITGFPLIHSINRLAWLHDPIRDSFQVPNVRLSLSCLVFSFILILIHHSNTDVPSEFSKLFQPSCGVEIAVVIPL